MRHVIDDSPESLSILLDKSNGGHSTGKAADAAPTGGEDDLPEGMEDAAADMHDAIHTAHDTGDHAPLAHALHNAISLAMAHREAKK